ncbi:Noc2-domain-containing protein [Hysterangium stoloniferum]|nr:Noc2-domain-containing protein [Hysterangium stoloniferum]
MGKKAPKASRKLAAKGELKRQIQERHKHQKVKKQINIRKAQKAAKANGKSKGRGHDKGEDGDEEDDEEDGTKDNKFQGMSVDAFLGAGFMNGKGESDNSGSDNDDDDDEDEDQGSEDGSFASVDELSDEGEVHLQELSKLAEKDPEFYKYLQENDQELLEFDPASVDVDDAMEGDYGGEEMEEMPILTREILKSWQKALLEQRSLRALRKLLVAFRSAAHIQDDDDSNVHLAWRIDNPTVFAKLVKTALRYTPVILDHHIPYKTLPNGKFKQPPTSKKFKALTKLLLSHFHNVIHVISSLPQHSSAEETEDGKDVEMTILALGESSKLLPYVIGSRKAVKVYLKMCLDLWSSAQDSVRIAAFLAIRRLGSASDEAILDLVLKGTYLTLVRSCKSTSSHTLPSITLMKNSASELYCLPGHDNAAYQHAFGYIRQLAILLRGGMKSMTKESYKQVYNWQFVHCVDFWTLVLARACGREATLTATRESELKALIYPLVQISLGAIQLIPTPRSYPYHLQILRSLLHLSRHTTTYIPLTSHILPILQYSLSPSTSGKSSSLRPLPLDTTIRSPAPYLRTRIYAETLAEEAVFVLAEWMGTAQVQGSIAFPEICVPIKMVLRKSLKGSKGAKQAASVKMLIERMEEGAKWIEERRRGVKFAPADVDDVHGWEEDVRLKLGDTPVGKALKILRKAREKRMKLLEKARDGEDEVLDT